MMEYRKWLKRWRWISIAGEGLLFLLSIAGAWAYACEGKPIFAAVWAGFAYIVGATCGYRAGKDFWGFGDSD